MNTVQRFLYLLLATLFLLGILAVPLLSASAACPAEDISGVSVRATLKKARRTKHLHNRAAKVPHRTKEWVINYLWLNGWVHQFTSTDTMNQIVDACVDVSAQYTNLDPYILLAVIAVESRFCPQTQGDHGRSLGLMQVQPRWHEERADLLGVEDFFDIYGNILIGADYLAEIDTSLRNYMLYALVGYNAGPLAGIRARDNKNPSDYAVRVYTLYEELRKIGGLDG